MQRLARTDERPQLPVPPAAAPALAVAIGNQAFSALVARQPVAEATSGALKPDDVVRLRDMVLPQLEMVVQILADGAGQPLPAFLPASLAHLRPVLPILQMLDPPPGSQAERVIAENVAAIKDEIAVQQALLDGGAPISVLPYWSQAYQDCQKILEYLTGAPLETTNRARLLVKESALPALQHALDIIDSPDLGGNAWDETATYEMLLGLAKEPQLQGWGMDKVAESFRRGLQVALAITRSSESALTRSRSMLDGAAGAFERLCGGGARSPRQAPPAPEHHPFPDVGPWP